MEDLNKIEQREPYSGELEFFKKNTHVGGMATEDNRVILNPFSKLSTQEKLSVLQNERARVFMRTSGKRPDFELTPEQRLKFSTYGSEQDIKETIAARK